VRLRRGQHGDTDQRRARAPSGRFAVADVIADEDMDGATRADMHAASAIVRASKPGERPT
jgi:hypothetical protein